MTWHQSLGDKGPVLRPRFIGTERAETQLLFYFKVHAFATLSLWNESLVPIE